MSSAALEPISYPPELPVSERRQEILDTIAQHQVVVIAGETGSGKSTQLPKLCLELGRGTDGWIGHTQPRRIAARSIAERVADELNQQVGETVGYAVRFTDKVSSNTRVKLMTDGILLAEIQRDRLLKRYDTIIIDEAHERSLNIDFLLGYLKQLLPRRPDLKLIITSATIDTARFSEHFDDAPVIEVTGRTYPVEVRYRPLDANLDEPLDQAEGVAEAVRELWHSTDGDILVFCSGEREIRDAAEAVEDLKLRGLETLQLYARLSAAEQHRVFSSHTSRRVVISTNVAETSLTVPGIRSVIDTGMARVSRYSQRTKVQRLPIEPVSQASANQRAGRCGRLGPGVCVRLYSEDDFLTRDEFTEPEIQRTNLASVILQMASLGLGQIDAFPFVEPPEDRMIRDGINLLEELDAVDPDEEGTKRWLTPMGRQLARLPTDPRLGRMVIEADRNGCVQEVLVIVSGLSIQDPRERPSDKREAAEAAHAKHAHAGSDFLTYINLWNYIRKEQKARGSSAFRRMCRQEFLHHQRIREWQDLERQLRRVAKDMGLRINSTEASPDAVHQALLAGLLSQIGMRDKAPQKVKGGRPAMQEYIGARNAKFVIGRGSALGKGGASWVMAGELVETNRLWARVLTGIDPRWLEDIGAHLVKRTFVEPRWDPARGTAVVTERVSLWGLPVVAGRAVTLGKVNPEMARELFIYHGLLEREFEEGHRFLDHAFLAQNDRVLGEVRDRQARSRQRDVEDEQSLLTAFYESRLPSTIVSAGHFNRWWKKRKDKNPSAMDLSPGDLGALVEVDDEAFPLRWHGFTVGYEFDAASPIDGALVDIPISALPGLDPGPFSWHVPGFRAELVEQLLRTLPKEIRKTFVPIPETARRVTPVLVEDERPIEVVLAVTLSRSTGTTVTPGMFDRSRADKHLRPTFRVVGLDGETMAAGKDLLSLKDRLDGSLQLTIAQVFADRAHPGAKTWDFGTVPSSVEHDGLVGYPALAELVNASGDEVVGVTVFATEDDQNEAMWSATRRLLRFHLRQPARTLDRQLDDRTKLTLTAAPVQSRVEWYNDGIGAAIDDLLARRGGPVWATADFEALSSGIRADIGSNLAATAQAIAEIVGHAASAERLFSEREAAFAQSVADGRSHLARLVYPGVLTGIGLAKHEDLGRYLRALVHRFEVLVDNPGRDTDTLATVRSVEADFARFAASGVAPAEAIEDIGWMIEEYRVSAFAPSVGAATRVSAKRIRSAMAAA